VTHDPDFERGEMSDEYDDGFESSFKNSEHSQYNFASSDSKGSSMGNVRTRGKSMKQMQSSAQLKDEELEDMLLQEARQQHMKVRATSLSKTRGR